MTLSHEDGILFFELMWMLQYFVNQKRGFHKDIDSREAYARLPTEKKLKARDELWKNNGLIEAYAQENPDALSPEELEIVRKWKDPVKGSFFILRHLKKGSIFIQDEKVYSVHGILDPLEEVIPSHALPQMVQAILLPFKGRIVYDGLLSGYSIHFGSGIRSTLERAYTAAKARDRIMTTFEPELAALSLVRPRKNITPQLKQVSNSLAKLKSDSPLQKAALALARASIELSLLDSEKPLAPADMESQARKIINTSNRLLRLLDIMEEE
ncbi:MAG: hypothetical protein ABI621_09835 [Chloroflexota bacterium]